MKRTAAGLLGLSIDQFWSTTPADYRDLMEGYNLRHDIEMQMLAWQTALLINVHSKRKIKPAQLLGKRGENQISEQEKLARLREQMERVSKKGPVF